MLNSHSKHTVGKPTHLAAKRLSSNSEWSCCFMPTRLLYTSWL